MDQSPNTRSQLLSATIEVLESSGPSAVRVRGISAAAGVTSASLYHFFEDREGLIAAAQAERYTGSLMLDSHKVVEGVAKCRNKREFRNLIKRLLREYLSEKNAANRMARINVLGSAQSRPALLKELAAAQKNYNVFLANAFRPAQRKGWIPQGLDLETFFTWYAGLLNGRVLVEIGETQADPEEWNRISIMAILATLVAPDDIDN